MAQESWFDRVTDNVLGGVGAFAELTKTPAGPAQSFTVNHDNVLQAAKVIQDQADQLQDLYRNSVDVLGVNLPASADLVNKDIADAWNDRLLLADDSYGARVGQYITSLNKLTGQLRDAAKQYGFTEDEVTSALGDKRA
ncbi:hypothetical protein F0L68_20430 [Solihabitans fulvus]|uniref:PE family protein n=1 Tax=Solihabitans fulvus TaxID=1892852 RepID=A0A5B2X9E7_9PSEU|nr:hypothetical protein [Solihabitans fulvus]KAA2260097.1 hypothetical protein F0L68_20430 [Solihabitans fulvus]